MLFVLSARSPLTKTITRTEHGLQKTPYPMVRAFTSHELPCTDLRSLYLAVDQAARMRWCLLKGELTRPLQDESRAGSTDPQAFTSWICLDIDGVELSQPRQIELQGAQTTATLLTPDQPVFSALDDVLAHLGLGDVSYVVQYSSSQGLDPQRLYCHVFMMLTRPKHPAVLKQWLQHLNLSRLRGQITLNKIGTALRWPLDITTCQNDKLLYVAAPTFVGMTDPVAERIRLVDKPLAAVPEALLAFDGAAVEGDKGKLLDELRKAASLPKIRASQYKVLGNVEYLSKPGRVAITGVKVERGFRYFNFNGGDSWAYYQPLDDPQFVYSFKGEPAYLLKELDPAYWAEIRAERRAQAQATHEYFSFFSPQADTIFNAVLDKASGQISLMPCATERRAQLFLENNGAVLPDVLPTYDIVYDPRASYVIDNKARLINTYRAPSFVTVSTPSLPEPVARVVRHAVGDGALFDWFFRWLRMIAIQRELTGVCLITHGQPGTGKGVMYNHIITPLVGASNAALISAERLLEQYNGWMENKLFIAVDEIDTESMGKEAKRVEAKLKTWIVEPSTPIRSMRQNPRLVKNYTNWMLLSNQPSPMIINVGDRRYQVGRYQPQPIKLTSDDIAALHNAIPTLYSWLESQQEVTTSEVRVLINSSDRAKLIDLGKTTIDSVAEKINAGDLEFFFAHLPQETKPAAAVDAFKDTHSIDLDKYKQALHVITLRATNNPDQGYVTRDELYALMQYLAGNIRRAPHHFASLLKHHRLYLEPSTPAGRPGHCVHTQWKHDPQWCRDMLARHLPDIGPRRMEAA